MEGIFTILGSIFGHGNGLIISHIVLAITLVLLVAFFATKSMKLVPSGAQNIMEAYLTGVISMGKDVIGEELARKYLPLVATIGLFVFFSNVIGIIPAFESPTSNINVTLTLALIVFVYYNYEGIKEQGVVHYFA
ncbi:MAG: F0F1 ATP synthase subunit A, partial [Epsilonproteobacteria bacterium]|nr:F0F1 ATP synthase subunit A [Campylobacterota bacterium]